MHDQHRWQYEVGIATALNLANLTRAGLNHSPNHQPIVGQRCTNHGAVELDRWRQSPDFANREFTWAREWQNLKSVRRSTIRRKRFDRTKNQTERNRAFFFGQ